MHAHCFLRPAKGGTPASGVLDLEPGRFATRMKVLATLLAICSPVAAQQPTWIPHGPGPSTGGQVENIVNGEVVGAINAVAPHPSDANTVYAGAVNGGIWKTTNAMAPSPTWERQSDFAASLSIGALEFDPTDGSNLTLVAGIGRFSSMSRLGGARSGLLRTTNGGLRWWPIDGGGTLAGLNVSGVAPRGSTIVISANAADIFANSGVWRSSDTGGTWTQMSGGAGTGLPAGSSFDLASDPTNPAHLFCNAGGGGIYRSTDTGATWSKVSDAAMDALVAGAANIKIAVGFSNNVYAGIVRGGQLAGVFRSADGGTTWTAMDLPTDASGGIHPGGQGAIHFSIAADRNNASIVYVGGDRQPSPSSIGAVDYSGRLFRGDASRPSGSQWVHLTHSSSLGPAGGGTTSNSAPHADSRDMDVAPNGVLIEVDDGGIYRRTNPRTSNGDWFSMNGDIQTAEFHATAWDARSHIVIGGAQDTGTPQQLVPSGARWQSVSTADGGVVAVDDSSTPGFSTRYSSSQYLYYFRRRVYDDENTFVSQVVPSLTVLGGGAPLQTQFYTPIELNALDARRLIIGGANSVYESSDEGDTLTEIAPGVRANSSGRDPIAYGAAGNPDALYVGAGAQVFVRTAASPAPLVASASYAGGYVQGVAIDPSDSLTAYVIDATRVQQTTNAGATWTDVTGNLLALNPGSLRSVAYRRNAATGRAALLVGADSGVFIAPAPGFTTWNQLGPGLPVAPVFELEYDAADDVLLAGTLGRGAWTFDFSPECGWTDDGPVVRLTNGVDRVGIGTTHPSKELEVVSRSIGGGIVVYGDASVGTHDSPGVHLDGKDISAAGRHGVLGLALSDGHFSASAARGDLVLRAEDANLHFATQSAGAFAARMTIARDGKVGIGTTSPSKELEVVSSSIGGGIEVHGDTGRSPGFHLGGLISGANREGVLGLALSGGHWAAGAAAGDLVLRVQDGSIHFANQPSSYAPRMTIGRDGVIYMTPANLDAPGYPHLTGSQSAIGWNYSGGAGETVFFQHGGSGWSGGFHFYSQRDGVSPHWLAELRGSGSLFLSGVLHENSDARDKVNIQPVSDALRRVRDLRGVRFEWKDGKAHDVGTHLGLLAQEVLQIVPEVVTASGKERGAEERYGLNYSGLIPLLIEAVKEQQQIIDDLRKRVLDMEGRVNEARPVKK